MDFKNFYLGLLEQLFGIMAGVKGATVDQTVEQSLGDNTNGLPTRK
jgi:hypothetical protein